MATRLESSEATQPTALSKAPAGERLAFVDALRALAAMMIALHHFAFYEPLSDQAMPVAGPVIDWFCQYGAVTQIFFVVGGYVLAMSMSKRTWDIAASSRAMAARYCRLGIPYLAAIGLAIAASSFGRGWVPENVVGAPPTWPQIIAHVFYLEQILGFESLSAGLWYVCIDFQLVLIYVALLYLRDTLAPPGSRRRGPNWDDLPLVLGAPLALASLFYFNLNGDWQVWAVYFFSYFFLGLIVHRGLTRPDGGKIFWMTVAMFALGMAYQWRVRLDEGASEQAAFMSLVRLGTGLAAAVAMYLAGKSGWMEWFPKSKIVAYLGRTSYSFFLVHFPMLIVIQALWARKGWDTPWISLAGLAVTLVLSLMLAAVFYRVVELPAARLSRAVAKGRSSQ